MTSRKTPTSPSEALASTLRVQTVRSVQFHEAVANRLGISVTDFTCINMLSLDGPMTPGELAARLRLTRGGAVTTMIDRLERTGYVRRRRDAQDRRRVYVELANDVAEREIAPLFAGLGTELNELLSKYPDEVLMMFDELASEINHRVAAATAALRA